jgi:predicted nucleic acid-binding protein
MTNPTKTKRQLARYLLNEDDWTVSVQVFQEFVVQATRATRADRLDLADAVALIGSSEPFTVQPVDSAVLHGALALYQAYSLSYWDAAILAAAQQSGCTLVLSENMTDGEPYGTVMVRNPFAVIRS